MTASSGIYPSLGRYFKSLTELAHAGCMSRRRARECLDGDKDFTRAEKKAITANIAMKILNQPSFDYRELEEINSAWSGKFDEVFMRKLDFKEFFPDEY